jgi:hypothetical protein
LTIFICIAAAENNAETTEDFTDCFSKSGIPQNTKKEIYAIVKNPPCFSQPFLATLKEYLAICYFPRHYRNSLKDCYQCQKIILGAVQMYNFEHYPNLRRINDAMLSLKHTPLIPEYLKHPFPRAEKQCRFKSIGDLARNSLFIYCTYHGSPQSLKELEKAAALSFSP